ncbi:MAG: hypothetical protein JST16_00745 [Bdellovibrionales bacterium]|nr:hypothetical protein [Bdellovibrionales bacterium]
MNPFLPLTLAMATCGYLKTTYTYPSHDKYTTTQLQTQAESCAQAKASLEEQCYDICTKDRDAKYCSINAGSFSCKESGN